MKLGTLLLGGVVAVGGCTGLAYVPIPYEYSSGDRVGTVDKFSYKGYLCKTWEGQLGMNNFRATGQGGTTNAFDFSVAEDNKKVIEQLQAAQENGSRVKLHYSQVISAGKCNADTSYLITSVTVTANQDAKVQAPGMKP